MSSDQEEGIIIGGSDDDEPMMTPQPSGDYRINYKHIEGQQIYKELQNNVKQLDQRLAMGKDWTLIIYNHYGWNAEKCQSHYFDHQKQVLSTLQYTKKMYRELNVKINCTVCNLSCNKAIENICGHTFCLECWRDYFNYQISTKVVFFRCMTDSCRAPILDSLIRLTLNTQSMQDRYTKALSQKYVQTNKTIKFCPGADCKKCISSEDTTLKQVVCDCGEKFCFRCRDQVHRPCECKDVIKWKDIVLKEEANANWITLNTKICPYCNKHVERSTGCNFMACAPPGGCGKSFCYVCSRPWEPDHKDHFKCNVYKPGNKEAEQKQKAKSILQKINFYGEKYLSNHKAKTIFKGLIQKGKQWQTILFDHLDIQLNQSEFIVNAYRIVMQSCDTLKWSYAYSFFIKEQYKSQKELFEFKQGDFERYKQNLAFKLETKLKTFVNSLLPPPKTNENQMQQEFTINKYDKLDQFNKIKQQIVTWYKYTEQYMHQMVNIVESGELGI